MSFKKLVPLLMVIVASLMGTTSASATVYDGSICGSPGVFCNDGGDTGDSGDEECPADEEEAEEAECPTDDEDTETTPTQPAPSLDLGSSLKAAATLWSALHGHPQH